MTKLGQHFLKNKAKIKKIFEALELKDGDTVIEIGPGHGELTKEIQKSKFKNQNDNLKIKILAIEKDRQLADYLRNKFEDDKNVEIIGGDALKLLPQFTYDLRLATNNYKIVGNIPYYITGYLLRILGELNNKPSVIVLLIQKEVAERVCANPPRINLLAASVQFWAEAKIIGYVGKKDFRPAPKVDSAIIKLAIRVQPLATRKNTEDYYKFIKILFKQPRKTIVNNLRPITNNIELITDNLKLFNINLKARPQDLSIKQIIELSTLF